jgi:hypothetical protein
VKLISEKALRRIFTGFRGAYDSCANQVWHQVFGPDAENLYLIPQHNLNVNADKLRDGELLIGKLDL